MTVTIQVAVDERGRRLAAIEAVRLLRAEAKPVSRREIQDWKQEGRHAPSPH